MQIEWLQTLVTVVKTGSYTETAHRLAISQPAVSKQIQQLERFFHAELKEWKGREFRLTPAGEIVHEFAQRVIGDLARVQEDASRLGSDTEHRLVIAAGPTLLYHYVPFLVAALESERPTVRLSTLTIMDQADLPLSVLDHRADVALHAGVALDPRLQAREVVLDRLTPVCNPRHPFATGEAGVVDLAKEKVLVLSKVTESRQLIDDWFRAQNMELQHPVELGAQAEIRAVLLATPSVGIVSRIAVAQDLMSARLVEISVPGFQVSRYLYASTRPDPSPLISKVLDLMSSAFEATRQPSEGATIT